MKQDKRNFVAKHMNDFNKAATHVDRKKKLKSGEVKHKRDMRPAI